MKNNIKKFPCEEEIVEVLIKRKNSIVKSMYKTLVVRELEVGSGILDLAILTVNEDILEKRLEMVPFPITNDLELVILACLLNKPLNPLDLSSLIGLNEKQVTKKVEYLCDRGFLLKIGNRYLCQRYIKPFFNRLISIEAKLNKWNRAMEQAFRNRLFSTNSFVALDSVQSAPAKKNLQEFVKNDIGLVVVNNFNKSCKVLFNPIQRKPISMYFTLLANEKILANLVYQKNILGDENKCLLL